MEKTVNLSYGECPGKLTVIKWATKPGWIRFRDGKRRLVRPGEAYVALTHDDGDLEIIERVTLH